MPTTDSTPTALTISAPRPPRKPTAPPDPTAPITPLDPPGILAQLLDPESFETLHTIATQHKLTLKELADRLEDDLDTLHRLVHVAHLRTAFMAAHAEHIALAALTQIAMLPLEDTSPRRLETVRRASTTITTISKRWTPILYDDGNAPPPKPPSPRRVPKTPPAEAEAPSEQPPQSPPAPDNPPTSPQPLPSRNDALTPHRHPKGSPDPEPAPSPPTDARARDPRPHPPGRQPPTPARPEARRHPRCPTGTKPLSTYHPP